MSPEDAPVNSNTSRDETGVVVTHLPKRANLAVESLFLFCLGRRVGLSCETRGTRPCSVG